MPYTDWQTDVSPADAKQEYGFVMSTTVDELSYMPSEEEKSRDAAQVVATGRKSWKTLKGKGEAVWPPLVEAALLDALEKYQPESVGSKSDKALGRFPRRNRFISDHIFETTGKRRTPKQVGSRLQQLRDTCKKEKILQLISRRSSPELPSTRSQSEESVRDSTSPGPENHLTSSPSILHHLIHVTISLQSQLWPAPVPSVYIVNNRNKARQVIQLSPSIVSSSSRKQSQFDTTSANILSCLARTIEFPSPLPLAPETTFSVYRDDCSRPVHVETVTLKCISSPMDRSGWLYTSELVPEFWETLCSMPDVTKYTILQNLKPIPSGNTGMSGGNPIGGTTHEIGVMYNFSAPERMARKSSAAFGPSYPVHHGRPVAQPSALSSQPAQSSAPNFSSSMFSAVGDNLHNNWIQPLTHTNYHDSDARMNQPWSENHQGASYGPLNPAYRIISTQKDVGTLPKYTGTEPSFDPSYQVNVNSSTNIYAPVPMPHSQQFAAYSYSYS